MSSHHFVKEGQEPALLILDADSSDVVMSLLEWSPTILVSAVALADVLSWGIKIDGIVTQDDNNISQFNTVFSDQGPVNIIDGSPAETYLLRALSSLKRSKQTSVNIISKSPTDHFFEVSAYLDSLDIAFVNKSIRWLPVARRFEKWYPGNTVLTVYIFDHIADINVHNGARDGDTIRTRASGLVSISSEKLFWLGELTS